MHNATMLHVSPKIVERETLLRLERVGTGPCGMTSTAILSNGHGEIIYRSANGNPLGVLGFCLDKIEDFCVAKQARRYGIASMMADYAKNTYGAKYMVGPFTPDGLAFARAWTDRQRI